MKLTQSTLARVLCSRLNVALLAVLATTPVVQATPFASGITTNGAGTVSFFMNEAGADVTVTFEDSTTLALGTLAKGSNGFPQGTHIGWSISCFKTGNGVPVLISSDAFTNSVWNSPRGIAANSNPKNAKYFGRLYTGNSAGGGTIGTTFKGLGLYALNADQTEALGKGTNATGTPFYSGSGGNGPWRLRVAADNTLLVDDFSTANASLFQYQPDLSSSNLVLSIIGQTAAVAAGIHGDFFGTPTMSGSLAEGNLVLWTADSGMSAPGSAFLGAAYDHGVASPTYQTFPGDANCVFRYDIGAGPLPWNHPPNYAFTMGLPGIGELRTEMDIGRDGKIICGFGRANLSNPNIQILDPQGTNMLYTSWDRSGGSTSDPWRGENAGQGNTGGTYAGVRVSPDGRFFASVDINNGITIASLTNGLPDDSSIFGIANTSTVGNARGMDWDAGDNLWVTSSGQGLLRCYSLGITATAVTTNDYTGTNGNFQLIVPPVTASLAVTTPLASQNYTNNPVGPTRGYGTPGVFTINLNTNAIGSVPVTVAWVNSGSANGPWPPFSSGGTNNFFMNLGTNANGVIITTNSITFPANSNSPSYPANWSADVQIIPTPTPVSGPSYSVNMRLLGGANYAAGAPNSGAVSIRNTGPQVLTIISVGATTGTTMNRSITNDWARWVVIRLGDTNGPGNGANLVTPTQYLVTNVSYAGTAQFPLDYTARAQRSDGGNNNNIPVIPADGSPGFTIFPGNVNVTNVIGNPVFHVNIFQPPTNVTINIALTNGTIGLTNFVSQENLPYSVTVSNTTITEIDNCVLPENVVLWSNPLTNALDSTNWTLVFASTKLHPTDTVLPWVATNYDNGIAGGSDPTNCTVLFGRDVTTDNIPPSTVMSAKGWTTALKMTINKSGNPAQSGVNLYPQGLNFRGNYALRFNMYLSAYSSAINNPAPGTFPREFAAFGVNHLGTNANWRLDVNPLPAGTGSSPTNSDGNWFAIDASSGSVTPADYDAFVPGPLPNGGVPNDKVSNGANTQNGVFKNPPFPKIANGGSPINQWTEVSVEITKQTNVTLLIDRSAVLTSFASTNNANNYSNGVPMLGYLDPVANQSDDTAFVYYSNLRVVKLSPYIITNLPFGMIVTQGTPSISFTSSCYLADAPVTNQWFKGPTFTTGNPPAGTGGPNGNPLTNATDGATIYTANATNLTASFTITNINNGTNIYAVFSDTAGSVASTPEIVAVVTGPGNKSASAGANVLFSLAITGPTNGLAIATYQWKTNGVNLVNSTHYIGVTSNQLAVIGAQASDAVPLYSCVVTHPNLGSVTSFATLTVTDPPTSVVVTPAAQTNLWGSTATFTISAAGTPPFTYLWRTNGTRLTNSTHYAGVTTATLNITNITRSDALTYTGQITNSAGNGSAVGVLTVAVPAPTLGTVSMAPGTVTLSFTSPNNPFDTTNGFILQSCGVVNGTYTNVPGTSFSGPVGGPFQVTAPRTESQMFYKLLHVN